MRTQFPGLLAAAVLASIPLIVSADEPHATVHIDAIAALPSAELSAKASEATATTVRRPVDWVDPRIDTVKPRWFYFASACRPFGLVNLSPDTQTEGDWNAGYRHGDTTIRCFSHLHGWQLAGLPVMPLTGRSDLASPASAFSHDDEVVRPGYHRVLLKTHGIAAELTSTTRVGFHRYTYPAGDTARVLLDLGAPLMECKMSGWETRPNADRTELAGSFLMGATMRRPKPVRVFFLAAFSRPFSRAGDDRDGKVLLDFGALRDPLLMKVALSYTGPGGARRNLDAELPHWDFDRVRRESEDDWNSWLGRIEVEGGTAARTTKFYTDLWHALLGRRIVSDVDGRYVDNIGLSPVIRQGRRPHHNFDALWGAQWSLNILWPLAWPEVVDEFCETMVNMYRNGGLIPRGPSGGNYTFVMIGDPAASFFAAAYARGIRSWDAEAAYAGLRKNAFPGGIRDHAGYEHRPDATGGGMTYYVDRGYVPEDLPGGLGYHRQGAAMTLEYAYQDSCLAQLARGLGKTDDAVLFEQRSRNYRNLWDPAVGWMRPRRVDGSWYEPFAPIGEGSAAKGFVESNSAIYSFFVPHDLPRLAQLFGGPAAAADRLEESFVRAAPKRFITDHGAHASAWVDYENQPSTALAHLFSHFGRPWRTQYWVRRVHDAAFSDITPFGGYNGDEDQGQMGALSALMALGLFAVDGGAAAQPQYEITTPVFDRITIHLDPRYYPGKSFTIVARGRSPEGIYIQSARLNGKKWNSFQFPHAAFAHGGVLELTLGPAPNKAWGRPRRPSDLTPTKAGESFEFGQRRNALKARLRLLQVDRAQGHRSIVACVNPAFVCQVERNGARITPKELAPGLLDTAIPAGEGGGTLDISRRRATSPVPSGRMKAEPIWFLATTPITRQSFRPEQNGFWFLRANGIPSVAAVQFTAKHDSAAATVVVWPGLGTSGQGVSLQPFTAPSIAPEKPAHAPSVEYQLENPEVNRARIPEAVAVARQADVVVLCLGTTKDMMREGWATYHRGDNASLRLRARQVELVDAILATGKPVIVLLFTGGPVTVEEFVDRVGALAQCWYLGQETGSAVADFLFGDVDASGRLPISIPHSEGQLPVFYNHKPTAKLRGYLFDETQPRFAFGQGLSYTTFSYANLRLDPATPVLPVASFEGVRALVDVTNTGPRQGVAVPQLYVRDEVASLTRPVKELKDFARVALAPGETRTVALTISRDKLAFIDATGNRVIEPGEFTIMVGSSSRDSDLLRTTLLVPGDGAVVVEDFRQAASARGGVK